MLSSKFLTASSLAQCSENHNEIGLPVRKNSSAFFKKRETGTKIPSWEYRMDTLQLGRNSPSLFTKPSNKDSNVIPLLPLTAVKRARAEVDRKDISLSCPLGEQQRDKIFLG